MGAEFPEVGADGVLAHVYGDGEADRALLRHDDGGDEAFNF